MATSVADKLVAQGRCGPEDYNSLAFMIIKQATEHQYPLKLLNKSLVRLLKIWCCTAKSEAMKSSKDVFMQCVTLVLISYMKRWRSDHLISIQYISTDTVSLHGRVDLCIGRTVGLEKMLNGIQNFAKIHGNRWWKPRLFLKEWFKIIYL